MNVLVPLAGPEVSFEETSAFGKSLAEIARKPVIEHVVNNLQTIGDARFTFVVKKSDVQQHHIDSVLRLLSPDCDVVVADSVPAGAACTCLLAIEHIDPDQGLLITNGDQIIRTDLARVIADFQNRDLDGGIIIFDAVHPRWSYVRLNDDSLVIEAAEKRPISRHATAGFYYYRRGADFIEAAQQMIRKRASVNDQYYVCPTYNEMILKQRKIGVFEIPKEVYFSLSSPQGVKYYEDFLTTGGSQ